MAEPTYALSWPRELFEWEAKRILEADDNFPVEKIALLLEEAFEDADVATQFRAKGPTATFGWDFEPQTSEDSSEKWFAELLADEARLRPYRAPTYWAQRNSVEQTVEQADPSAGFAAQYIELVDELSERGYLPKVLPPWFADEESASDDAISSQIAKAIRMPLSWGALKQNPAASTDALIYSLVEYFHDQTQRPRTYWIHEYGGCRHHADYNAVAGQTVYRWKVNQLLRDHSVPLQLATRGEEQGRLVREFSPPMQDFVESQLAARDEPGDEIAHAIRDFRSRGASLVVKRAAITLIANNLEARRQTLKVELEQDENDLFNMANNYQLRHRNARQKEDYGHEFADWIFWNFLAAVELLDSLERRGSGEQKTNQGLSTARL